MANSTAKKNQKINITALLIFGGILLFAAAFVFYFANSFITTEREYAVYSSMEEPTLPVVYAEVEGSDVNLMHGYLQDMGNAAESFFYTVKFMFFCTLPVVKSTHRVYYCL